MSAATQKTISTNGKIILGAIFGLYVLVTIIYFLTPSNNTFNYFVRLFGLWGYIALAIATMMVPFLMQISKTFGKSFLKVHHFFAFIGIVLISLHPIVLAIQVNNLAVFLPNFESWLLFWILAGRPALIILYIALFGILFKKKLKYWRGIHALMYVMLLMGFVHGILIGTDFANVGILVIFTVLFVLTMVSMVAKRVQLYRIAQKKKNKSKPVNTT